VKQELSRSIRGGKSNSGDEKEKGGDKKEKEGFEEHPSGSLGEISTI